MQKIEVKIQYKRFLSLNDNDWKIFYRGYFIIKSEIIRDKQAINLIKNSLLNNKSLDDLKSIDGCFLVIIINKKQNKLFIINDRIGSIPLFYKKSNTEIVIADTIAPFLPVAESDIDTLSITEILCGRYTAGDNTIIKKVFSLLPAHTLTASEKEIKIERYWSLRFDEVQKSDNILRDEFESIVNDVFMMYHNFLKNFDKILIPLSGGYDSRLIADKLSNLKNATTLTYGQLGENDLNFGIEIAKNLHLKNIHVVLSEEFFQDVYTSKDWKNINDNWNIRSDVHNEAYASIHNIEANKNYLILPGHSLDMLAGSHFVPRWFLKKPTRKKIVDDLYTRHYRKFPRNLLLNKNVANDIKNNINSTYLDDEAPIGFDQRWNLEHRQSTLIINSVREYEQKNIQWMLPLWDMRFIEFFCKLPMKYKFEESFYRKILEDMIFSKKIASINKKDTNTISTYFFKLLVKNVSLKKKIDTQNKKNSPHHPRIEYISREMKSDNFRLNPFLSKIINTRSEQFNRYIESNNFFALSKITLYHLSKHLDYILK